MTCLLASTEMLCLKISLLKKKEQRCLQDQKRCRKFMCHWHCLNSSKLMLVFTQIEEQLIHWAKTVTEHNINRMSLSMVSQKGTKNHIVSLIVKRPGVKNFWWAKVTVPTNWLHNFKVWYVVIGHRNFHPKFLNNGFLGPFFSF